MRTVELQPNEFGRVLPMYRAAGICFPLISAVIHNSQRGQVFADDRETPTSAVVVTDFGFMLFLGAEDNESFNAGVAGLFAAGEFKPSYLLWYSPPISWQRRLDAVGGNLVKRRERIRFEFDPERAVCLATPNPSPAGFELKSLSAELISKTEKFGVKIESRFWASAEDFLEHGLGVCLLKDAEVVSICYAAAMVDGLAEIDVATDPEFRGRGLASVTAQVFIRDCLRRRVLPTWDCFDYNTWSIRLALKLGFVSTRNYAFYSFNVPAKV